MVAVERVGESFNGRDDHGHIFGFASCEHRVDRHFLRRHRDLAVFDESELEARLETCGSKHAGDAVRSRRYDGQAVGPAFGLAQLHGRGHVGSIVMT